MGSTRALICNPHLNNTAPCFKCLNTKSQPRTILSIDQRRSKFLGLSKEIHFKKFSRTVCSAVEDVAEKQPKINGGSLNGAVSAVGDGLVATKFVKLGVNALAVLFSMGRQMNLQWALEKPSLNNKADDGGNFIYDFLYPNKELLPDDKEMSIYDHLEELRGRIFVSVLAVGAAMAGCFAFSKELIMFLEAPVSAQGVRFLQLAPGEFFFTSLKVSGYCGILLGPVILYEIIAFILPGLTKAERRFLGPIVLGPSLIPSNEIEKFKLFLSTFFLFVWEGIEGMNKVPVIQVLLGQLGLVSSEQMLSIWRYVVVGSVIAAAILTPSTDPLTQMLLAGPLMGLYLGGAWVVKLLGR
ncbi:Sec-independent protein translocase protein TATC, chloroplastic [Sesamum angolense]|uniref:Sec-independent protein translocase protein TATC, chloroplastic n=1 Tax=Sesamum angolense TaxID=2727404 RepID=A0AAE1WV57_9LAMI|nr:Sec-independent protein translocase protein TATC, chloroplastic [Sesamum angolense]